LASREDLVLRFIFLSLLSGIGGSMITLYVNTPYDARYPYLRKMFLVFAGVCWLAGLYLAVSTALLLA